MDDDLSDLSLLLAPAVHEPGPAPVERHLAAGRAALRRRRLAVGTATLVALGAVGSARLAVGQATPGRTLQDPAAPHAPRACRPPPRPRPTRRRTRHDPPGPTRGVADGPDVIGPTRAATAAEAAQMRAFGNQRGHARRRRRRRASCSPGWRVVDRIDDPAPVTVLNRGSSPKDVVDAVAVEVAPTGGTPGTADLPLPRPGLERRLEHASSEPVGPLSGSLAWWTTQKVYADSPMSNGTPGVDVRLLDDGRLAPEAGTEILEERRDADVGGYLRARADAHHGRAGAGRRRTRALRHRHPGAELLRRHLVRAGRRAGRPRRLPRPGASTCTARSPGEPPAPLGRSTRRRTSSTSPPARPTCVASPTRSAATGTRPTTSSRSR